MYLAELHISNFRKIANAIMHFQEGLNILVGANNVGKTAVVDALRALCVAQDEPYPRLSVDDIHRPKNGNRGTAITFKYIFRGLNLDDEADFLSALQPTTTAGTFEVHISVRFSEADNGGRLRSKRWCGSHEEVSLTSDMLDNLRGIYLPPLRDASQGLRPSRNSQLSRLLHLLSDNAGREDIDANLMA